MDEQIHQISPTNFLRVSSEIIDDAVTEYENGKILQQAGTHVHMQAYVHMCIYVSVYKYQIIPLFQKSHKQRISLR